MLDLTLDLVGELDIAKRLAYPTNTVHQWARRRILPAPDGMISNNPWWHWVRIESWAESTGRTDRRKLA